MILPTRRGIATVGAVLAAVLLAWLFGERSLNAVAAPAVVALLAGVVQVVLADEPTVDRSAIPPAFPGETRTISLTVEGGSTVVDVTDHLPDAVSAPGRTRTLAPPATLTFDLQCDRRGEYTIGPTSVRVRDVLGLFQRTVTGETETTLLVYPRVYELPGSGSLVTLLSQRLTPDRQAFEEVREYVPGDPLRDVHWGSSAKRPDELIVKQFAGRSLDGSVSIAGSASPGMADEMAAATASVAIALLEADVAVDVHVPNDSLTAGETTVDREAVLGLLARADHGQVAQEDWSAADVTITADQEGVRVRVGDRSVPFERWRRGTGSPLAATDAGASAQPGVSET